MKNNEFRNSNLPMKKIVLFFSLCFIQLLLLTAFYQNATGSGRIIYVAKTGNDAAEGSLHYPLLTINHALLKAAPGDQVIISKGIYRELVIFNKGGISETQRITIRAAAGETVNIKGSEQVKTWTKQNDGLWSLILDTAAFRGMIFFNDQKMHNKERVEQVNTSDLTWTANYSYGKVLIKANFGNRNPNIELTEVPIRSAGISGGINVNYILLDGIQVSQVFSPVASIYAGQKGAIETGGGTHWTIQNCTIRDCNSVGISIGNKGRTYPDASPRKPEFSDYNDIEAIGHHIIRNNHITKCGQAGVFGLAGGTASLIEGNLIEDINIDATYTGTESGGIRLALAVDAIIKRNLIRNIKGKHGYGIYLGPLFQAARISENIIADTEAVVLYLFNSHGPALIDNNVLACGEQAGKMGVRMLATEANVYISNLFYNCHFANERQPGRSVATSNYLPHTLIIKQTIPSLAIDHRWLGNIFVKQKLELPGCWGCQIDYNTYKKDAKFHLAHTAAGANLEVDLKGCTPVHPDFDAEFIGFFSLSKQYIEYPNGKPRLPISFSLIKNKQ